MAFRSTCWLATCLFGLTMLGGCGGVVGSDDGDGSEAIIGGSADSGDPSVVALFAHQPNASVGSLCTATVIAPTKLLTAAHCCAPSVIGAGNVFEAYAGPTFSASATRLGVSRCDFDPQFDAGNLGAGHDVAVVTLSSRTSLPPVGYSTTAFTSSTSKTVRLVGYGDSTHGGAGAGVKRQLTTTVDDFDTLFLHIGASSRQTCHGDSGGPALQRRGGVDTIVGITSYGYDNSTKDVCYGGGYDTRVDRYATFIHNHL